jgi:uncharacterized membrane protein YjjB (DUF3815 family)
MVFTGCRGSAVVVAAVTLLLVHQQLWRNVRLCSFTSQAGHSHGRPLNSYFVFSRSPYHLQNQTG